MDNKQIASRVARLEDGKVIWFRNVHVFKNGNKWQIRAGGEFSSTKSVRRCVAKIRQFIEPGQILLIDTYCDGVNGWFGTVELDGVDLYTTDFFCETENDARWTAQDWVSFNLKEIF